MQAGETLLVNGGSGTTGGLIVSLAVVRGVRVLATASPSSHDKLARAGALTVVDYHNRDWTEQIVETTDGHGVDAAANAARRGAASALRAVRHGGRLATITSDPPAVERGIEINSVCVRPDAAQLDQHQVRRDYEVFDGASASPCSTHIAQSCVGGATQTTTTRDPWEAWLIAA